MVTPVVTAQSIQKDWQALFESMSDRVTKLIRLIPKISGSVQRIGLGNQTEPIVDDRFAPLYQQFDQFHLSLSFQATVHHTVLLSAAR